MKHKGIYYLVLSIIVCFIIILSCDFLGDHNPIRIACEQITNIIYKGGQ